LKKTKNTPTNKPPPTTPVHAIAIRSKTDFKANTAPLLLVLPLRIAHLVCVS
jgi:hypothetical protein